MTQLLAVLGALTLCLSLNAHAEDAAPKAAESSAPAASAPPATAPAATAAPKRTRASLSDKEKEILNDGPIGTGQYVAGGVVGTLLGLGIGQAIEGRYSDTGWIITVGEITSLVFLVSGASNCVNSVSYGSSNTVNCSGGSLATIGALGYLGFRIWELIDVWAGPPIHNSHYRRIKRKLGEDPEEEEARLQFYAAPVAMNSSPGLAAGVQFHF